MGGRTSSLPTPQVTRGRFGVPCGAGEPPAPYTKRAFCDSKRAGGMRRASRPSAASWPSGSGSLPAGCDSETRRAAAGVPPPDRSFGVRRAFRPDGTPSRAEPARGVPPTSGTSARARSIAFASTRPHSDHSSRDRYAGGVEA